VEGNNVTAYELQKDLAEEVEEILHCMLLKDARGNGAHLRAFLQSLPKRMQGVWEEGTGEETEEIAGEDIEDDNVMTDESAVMEEISGENDPYPYCIVKIDSGELQPAQNTHEIQTTLIFGIYDDDKECQGHQVIMNMIHKISERFGKNPYLMNKYRMNHEVGITWILADEDRYPYYFGAMEMTWETFFVRLEDDKYA